MISGHIDFSADFEEERYLYELTKDMVPTYFGKRHVRHKKQASSTSSTVDLATVNFAEVTRSSCLQRLPALPKLQSQSQATLRGSRKKPFPGGFKRPNKCLYKV